MLPDPDDNLVLETAVNGHAEAVITSNRQHFAPAAASFGIEILAPAEAVRRLEGRA
jgi:predicted nucleic acid-binding protein